MNKKSTQTKIKVITYIAAVLFFQHYVDQARWHIGNITDTARYYHSLAQE
jgi:hypothetical protein